MIFARAVAAIILTTAVVAASAGIAVAEDPPPPTIEYVGDGKPVCPPEQDGWTDTSVSESLQFCFHDDHGAMPASNARALHEEQSLRIAQAAGDRRGSGSVSSRAIYNKNIPFNVYTSGDDTHWRTVAINYNKWVDSSGCTKRDDGAKCDKIVVASSNAAKCTQLEIPSGLGYTLAGGYEC